MIVKIDSDFFIQFDVVEEDEHCSWFKYGPVNWYIDGKNILSCNGYHTLSTTIGNIYPDFLKQSKRISRDLGWTSLSDINFNDPCSTDSRDFNRMIRVGRNSMLTSQGYDFRLGYAGDKERFFYSVNSGESFSEKVFDKGSVEKMLSEIPDFT